MSTRKPRSLKSLGFDETTFNRAYVMAKITTSPHDYTLKDRAVFISDELKFSILTSVFEYGAGVEVELCERLGLNSYNGLCVKDVISPSAHHPNTHIFLTDDEANCYGHVIRGKMVLTNTAYMYKHNDLLINDCIFYDLQTILTKKLIDGMMKMHVLINAKDSIIPQLTLSRIRGVESMTLDDVVNLKFVKHEFELGHECFLGLSHPEVQDLDLLKGFALNAFHGNDYLRCVLDPTVTYVEDKIYSEIARQNVIVAGMYFCELARAYDMLDAKSKDSLSRLLFDMHSSKFVSMFCTYDKASDTWKCEPELEDIIHKPAAERYAMIPAYVEDRFLKEYPDVFTWGASSYRKALEMLGIPMFLVHVFSELHYQAWQDYRIKHFTMLLKECESRGVKISDLSTPSVAMPGGMALPAIAPGEEPPDFGDMTLGTEYAEDDGDSAASPTLPPSPKSETSALETMDNLSKSCDTKYNITVEDCDASNLGCKSAYEGLLAPIDMVTKQLTKQIREIKTYNVGGKSTGRTKGKVDSHKLYRYKTDPRIFYDNTYKVKEMDLAFGIVLDQSGSMRGDGIANGKIALILLHHVLNSLRINHAVIGHTSNRYHNVIIKRYVMFNEDKKHTLKIPYGLAGLSAFNGNCDSGALNYMEQYIKRTRNKDKIVLIFSDGEPTECSETELRKQVRKMESEGIHVIGLGINFENIKMYYPDHANGRNMKEMVDILVSILKRYVLEKED